MPASGSRKMNFNPFAAAAAMKRREALLIELGAVEKFIEDHAIPKPRGNPAWRPWGKDELAGLKEWWWDGFSSIEIAERLKALGSDRTAGAVRTQAYERHFEHRPRLWGPSRYQLWPAKEDAQLEAHRKAGATAEVIAFNHGRTTKAVTRRIIKLRLGPVAREPQERPRDGCPLASVVGPINGADAPKRVLRCLDPSAKAKRQLIEPSRAWDDKAKDRALRLMWKKPWSNYVIAKRLGKTAPQVAQRGRELKLGPRPRRDSKRKCLNCQEPFAPRDWTTDWYCTKHRKHMAQMSEDLTMRARVVGRI